MKAANGTRIRLPQWAAPFLKPARFKSARGGRGSSKSHTFAQINIMRMALMLPDYPLEPVRIASCRDFNVTLKSSVKVAVEKYIHQLGLSDGFEILATEIRHRYNGSYMNFHGVNRNPDSFLSMEDLDVFWMEQAENLGDEMIKVEPTMRKPGSELHFVWNPDKRTSYCWKRLVLKLKAGDVSVLVNYRDNPWWFPVCFDCNIRYRFRDRDRKCQKCGKQIWPGLWEMEETRRYYEEMEPSLYSWMWLGQPNDGDASHQILPYEILLKCVEAYKQGLYPPYSDAPVIDMGLDIAQGGRNKCAQVIRIGPRVEYVDVWPGIAGDLSEAAGRCHSNSEGYDVDRLYYDGSSPIMTEFYRLDVDYAVRGVNFGGEVGGKEEFYEPRRLNGEMFRARNVQMADALRLRANRTVKLLKGDDDEVDPSECLFINPEIKDLEMFLAELTQPIRRKSPLSGKWELDKRGPNDENAESPDSFDALCLSFARDSDNGLRARGGVV